VSSLRKTSSGSGSGFTSAPLGGVSSDIGKPSEDWIISDKESLIAWVSRFLWHYEMLCSDNGPEESPDNPALTIVDNILKTIPVLKDGEKSDLIRLPAPASYFQIQDNHQP